MWPLVIYLIYLISYYSSPCSLFLSYRSLFTTLKSQAHSCPRAFAIPSAWSVFPSRFLPRLLCLGLDSNAIFSGGPSTVILCKTTMLLFLHFSGLFYFSAYNVAHYITMLFILFLACLLWQNSSSIKAGIYFRLLCFVSSAPKTVRT